MYMDNNGWKWLDVTGNGWKYPYMAGMAKIGWKVLEWLQKTGHGWNCRNNLNDWTLVSKSQELMDIARMAENTWIRLEMAGISWGWL